MHYQTTRKLARATHIFIALLQFVYVYSPVHHWPLALPLVQWVTFPLLTISGVWLWKGHKMWLWKLSHRKRADVGIAQACSAI